MKKYSTIVLFLFVYLSCPSFAKAEEAVGVFDPAQQCARELQYKCYHGDDCHDGWGMVCYYDSNASGFEPSKLLGAQKDKCYGLYDSSVCEPCRHVYQIEGKDVGCESFYGELNKKNAGCQGCLKSESDGGG